MSSTEKCEGLNLIDGSTKYKWDRLVKRCYLWYQLRWNRRISSWEKIGPTWFVWIFVLFSTISGLPFDEWILPKLPMPFVYSVERNTGYHDTGVISGALVTILGSDLGTKSQYPSSTQFLFDLTFHHRLFNRNLSPLQPYWALYWVLVLLLCSLRSEWMAACSGHSGYYIYRRGYWSSSLPYGMEHLRFFLLADHLPIINGY